MKGDEMEPISAILLNEGYCNQTYKHDLRERVSFPMETDELRAVLDRIGIDGVVYTKVKAFYYLSDLYDLKGSLPDYPNLSELNYLAHLIADMDALDIDKLECGLRRGVPPGDLRAS